MGLNAIDIAYPYQDGIDIPATKATPVIIKATGGVNFVNPVYSQWADTSLAAGRKIAFYHYAQERTGKGSPSEEARHFLDHVMPYKGKFVPILDWEADALSLPQSWAVEWLDIVAAETGATPFFYGYASNVNSTDYSLIAAKYPLWMASYLNRYIGSDFVEDPVNIWTFGDWSGMKMYQYTSQGRIQGYWDDIDLSYFYGEDNDWDRMCGLPAGQIPGDPINGNGIRYRAHVQNLGWCDWVHDGQIAGTTGHALRLEALQVEAPGWEIACSAHLELLGWKKYGPGVEIGTVGEARRLEALGFDVLKRPNNGLSLEFQVHVEGYGWLPWTKEGYATGSVGQARRIEAVRLVLR